MDLCSLLFINMTAAMIPNDDLHCRVSMYSNIDFRLVLKRKWTLLHKCKCNVENYRENLRLW